MEFINNILNFSSEFLFPSGCCLCGNMLIEKKEIQSGICDDCSSSIKIEHDNRCIMCGRPLISEKEICMNCREGKIKISCESIYSIFPYTGIYRQLLWAFKYGKSAAVSRFMADKLFETISQMKLEAPVLVPVPPRPGKIRKTGWDQIDCLSGVLRRKNKYRISNCLVRLANYTQKKLKKEERILNLEGKIRFAPGVKNKKAPPLCVLFDDVITTGATMNACAAALKEAGAEKVYGVCLVYD